MITTGQAIKHISNQGGNVKASTCSASGSLRSSSNILEIAKPEGVSNSTKIIPWCSKWRAANTSQANLSKQDYKKYREAINCPFMYHV
uniref:Uncharacterized protein n=1 Tax=Setaria italica TaxID=4555 RepID=K3YKI4_SETIT